jgi:hypothetical protein
MSEKAPSIQTMALRGAKWAVRKYRKDAPYMITHTHEFTEGFLDETYGELTGATTKKVRALAETYATEMLKKPTSKTQKYEIYFFRFNGGGGEHRIKVGNQEYFSWHGGYFDRKSRAEADLKKVEAGQFSGHGPSTWGYKVFRTDFGWGVFAEV